MQAVPYTNFKNKFLFYLLISFIKFKTTKDFLDLINDILKNIFVFEKDIETIDKFIFDTETKQKITKMIVPESVKELINFIGLYNLKELIIINENLLIKKETFCFCSSLKKIILPTNLFLKYFTHWEKYTNIKFIKT